MPADGPSRNSSSESSSRISSKIASRESSDSMSMCRCASSWCARRSSIRRRSAASRLPFSGASGRSSGVSADTFTERFARASGPIVSRSSCGRSGQRRVAWTIVVERAGAALGVALGLVLRDRRLAEQVDRRGDAVLPEVAQDVHRRLRALADDEAVRHPPHAGGGGGAERLAARLRAAHPHGDGDRRRRLADLAQEAGQVAGEVVEVAAGGDDVDEAEQRRLELLVGRGEVHRLVVDRLQRVARLRGHVGSQPATDLMQVGFQASLVHQGDDTRRANRARRGEEATGAKPAAAAHASSRAGSGGDGRPITSRSKRRASAANSAALVGPAQHVLAEAPDVADAVAEARPERGQHRRGAVRRPRAREPDALTVRAGARRAPARARRSRGGSRGARRPPRRARMRRRRRPAPVAAGGRRRRSPPRRPSPRAARRRRRRSRAAPRRARRAPAAGAPSARSRRRPRRPSGRAARSACSRRRAPARPRGRTRCTA